MNDLKTLLDLDFKYLFFGFCLILIVGKTLWITIEWLLIEKLGLETKKQKERREDKKGKIAYWFLKSETQWVYKKWNENRPVEQSKNMED